MLPVSPRFLSALRETHVVSIAASVYRPGRPDEPLEVAVIGGEVRIDRDARVRRQGSLTVAFTLEDPSARDLVRELPFGGYCTIERGIRYADGTVERVQLGRFRVDSVVWPELQGQATLTLVDRMAQIQDEPFTELFAPYGLTASPAIVAIGQQVFGSSIQYHVLTDPATEPLLGDVVYTEDRASAMNDLASSISAEAIFDNLGDLVVRPRDRPPEIAWTVDAGLRGSMLEAEETLDRSSVRNGVVVRGQPDPATPPIWALATYDDPAAPTRWGGPFGKVALISDSSAVQDQTQAYQAARSLLNLRLALQRTLTISSLPNPALEPDDLIRLEFADGRTETQKVNSTRIALDSTSSLTLTTTNYDAGLPSLITTLAGRAARRELRTARLVAA